MAQEERVELMEMAALAERCREETTKFFREEENDCRYCWELFRRALIHGNDEAWHALVKNYQSLVRGWILQCGGIEMLDVSIDELSMRSFEKLWHATQKRNASQHFTALQPLLKYLQACCLSVVTDALRSHQRRQMYADLYADLDETVLAEVPSHQHVGWEVAEREAWRDLWDSVTTLLRDTEEKLILFHSFYHGFKPRHIHEHYPTYFPDVEEIYRIKRNAIERLRNSTELRAYLEMR